MGFFMLYGTEYYGRLTQERGFMDAIHAASVQRGAHRSNLLGDMLREQTHSREIERVLFGAQPADSAAGMVRSGGQLADKAAQHFLNRLPDSERDQVRASAHAIEQRMGSLEITPEAPTLESASPASPLVEAYLRAENQAFSELMHQQFSASDLSEAVYRVREIAQHSLQEALDDEPVHAPREALADWISHPAMDTLADTLEQLGEHLQTAADDHDEETIQQIIDQAPFTLEWDGPQAQVRP